MARLTAEDCPAVLSNEGKALWGALVAQRPTDKLLGAFVAAYVEALLAWQRATEQIKVGDYGRPRGEEGPAKTNPYLRLRRDAERSMMELARFLGWQPTTVIGEIVPASDTPKSRLELFLAARGKA